MSICRNVSCAVVVMFGSAVEGQAESVSGKNCEKIGAAIMELAQANLAYIKMAEDIAFLNLEFVAEGGNSRASQELSDKFNAALGKLPVLDDKVVGEGISSFRKLCPVD